MGDCGDCFAVRPFAAVDVQPTCRKVRDPAACYVNCTGCNAATGAVDLCTGCNAATGAVALCTRSDAGAEHGCTINRTFPWWSNDAKITMGARTFRRSDTCAEGLSRPERAGPAPLSRIGRRAPCHGAGKRDP